MVTNIHSFAQQQNGEVETEMSTVANYLLDDDDDGKNVCEKQRIGCTKNRTVVYLFNR